MGSVQIRSRFGDLYSPPVANPVLVDVPDLPCLMVDGEGKPDGSGGPYAEAIEALFSVSYTVHFSATEYGEERPGVCPLESLWWVDDGDLLDAPPEEWRWTAFIVQPDWLDTARFAEALIAAGQRRRLPALPRMRLDTLREGRSAQIMHVGPYAAEAPTIRRLHAFIVKQGLRRRDRHHEIYLGDPRRTRPERLRTVIRQPVEPA
jgi:hypothetical protein